VIRDISLSVNQGDVVAVLGPSGSGKTTLLRCAGYLSRADGGTVALDGETFVDETEDVLCLWRADLDEESGVMRFGMDLFEREGELWYWNQIQTETESLYFDLHAAALNDTVPVLMTAEELVGYSWDPERYPEAETEAPPEETQEATQEAITETQEIPETTQE
jgi:ABC-type cobalamin/Fe3+-siderophores transport system ATPase subunit